MILEAALYGLGFVIVVLLVRVVGRRSVSPAWELGIMALAGVLWIVGLFLASPGLVLTGILVAGLSFGLIARRVGIGRGSLILSGLFLLGVVLSPADPMELVRAYEPETQDEARVRAGRNYGDPERKIRFLVMDIPPFLSRDRLNHELSQGYDFAIDMNVGTYRNPTFEAELSKARPTPLLRFDQDTTFVELEPRPGILLLLIGAWDEVIEARCRRALAARKGKALRLLVSVSANWLKYRPAARENLLALDCELVIDQDGGDGSYRPRLDRSRRSLLVPYGSDDSAPDAVWVRAVVEATPDGFSVLDKEPAIEMGLRVDFPVLKRPFQTVFVDAPKAGIKRNRGRRIFGMSLAAAALIGLFFAVIGISVPKTEA